MMIFLKLINANLIYTMSFLMLLANVGRDPHYVATFALISAITIILAFKTSLKHYNELNIFIGGILIYCSFFINTVYPDFSPILLILGLSIGASLILQTVFYKHPRLFPVNAALFTVFSLFAITGVEFLSQRYYFELTLEIGVLLSFLGLILNEPRAWSRLIISIALRYLHPTKLKGVEHIKSKEGPFVFVANHPSFYDCLIIEQSLPCEADFFQKNINEHLPTKRLKRFTLFHQQIEESQVNNNEPVEQACQTLKNNRSLVIMPECQISQQETSMNEWGDDLERIIEAMSDVTIVPVAIKDIHTHYKLHHNENSEVLSMTPVKYFHPIEIEFGAPIKIDNPNDASKVRQFIEKMGKNRL